MTPQQIDQLLRQRYPTIEAHEGERWQVQTGGQRLVVLSDAETDRVRVLVPVAQVDEPDPGTLLRLLEANFADTLDARYAVFNGVLWAVFVAPLGGLDEHAFEQALGQVLELAQSTGTSYSASPSGLGRGFFHLH